MSERIEKLKKRILAAPRYASVEQALIITRIYQQKADESNLLKRAWALKAALEEMEISIEAGELIVGNRTAGIRAGVVFPESGSSWVDREFETLPVRPQDKFQVHPEDITAFRQKIKPFWQGVSLEDMLRQRYGKEIDAIAKVVKINQKDHAQGHICPDCRLWLEKGPAKLREEALQKLKSCREDQKDFYQAVVLVMEGAIHFIGRYRDLLREKAVCEQGKNAEELEQVAAVCDHLTYRAPSGFHEAVQLLWFLFVLLQMESNASSFSPGRMDRYLYPYYKKDIEAGILSETEAFEIICCLWLKFNEIVYMRNAHSAKYFAGFPIGFNVALGGVDEEGNPSENELTRLFLQAQEEIGMAQPNLSVRLHKKTSKALLEKSVAVVAKGSGMPQFFNDEAVIPGLLALGIEKKDALDYAIVGCVELTTQGNNLGWSDAAMFNMNKALELVLNHGRCLLSGEAIGPDFGGLDTYTDFAALEDAFARMLDFFIEKMIKACEEVEKVHMERLPSPFLSAVIDDCLEKGLDVTAGGAHYNFSGIQMIQIANLADSLAALKKLVYDEKQIVPADLLTALRENFAGQESLRARLLYKVEKYGNDAGWVDALGVKWADYFRSRLDAYTNLRNGKYHTGMYTVSAHVPMGENVGASPDGRLAGTPLADGGLSPAYGRDKEGPTAVLKSVSRLGNHLTTNGGLLNMKFLPDFFATKTGREKFCQFLRAFVDLEIPHIQFNVLRKEDLLEAKKHPEEYRSLTVRVAGYTAYFTELDGKLQDEIIARTSYDHI